MIFQLFLRDRLRTAQKELAREQCFELSVLFFSSSSLLHAIKVRSTLAKSSVCFMFLPVKNFALAF